MPSQPAPLDTDALLASVEHDAEQVRQARTRLALAGLGLITACIRADHPAARYLQLGFTVSMKTYTGRTEAGRVWLQESEQAGRWRACLDDDARSDLEGWCTHLGQDVEELLPMLWVQDRTTGLQVVDLDAVVAALS
ncbi:hypothetical protein [Kitasatospora sp. NPDC018614]|uniref:hypothetical protein n=1 Tax=Kitasatospora sp. NPDC018614 TaxID=3364026 RepID=UPI00378FE140